MPLLVDTHVHIYGHYNVSRFLDAAHSNMGQVADVRPVLMLTETAQDDAFTQIANERRSTPGWRVERLPEDSAAVLMHPKAGEPILLVAGRQIITAEKLEILALATTGQFADGVPAEEVLNKLIAAEVPAVMPWGVGKWIGARGALVSRLLEQFGAQPGIMLGDIAGRPMGWPRPKQFQKSAAMGVPILMGSDPLPIPDAEAAVGRYGVHLDATLSDTTPAADLRAALLALRGQPQIFGKRCGPISMLKDQVALRTQRQN